MIILGLLPHCAPHVAPTTMNAIVKVESGGNPIALNINGIGFVSTKSVADAVAKAKTAIAGGHNVDMGLMQINSRTAARLGYSVGRIFDPCVNLTVGAGILRENYHTAAHLRGNGQAALQAALSAYNTGNETSGFSNGYVARYYGALDPIVFQSTMPIRPPPASSKKKIDDDA